MRRFDLNISERDAEVTVDLKLKNLNWVIDPKDENRNVYHQKPKNEHELKKLGKDRPDFILYSKNSPVAVIEVKRPRVKNLELALKQSISYCEKLSCRFAFATNGFVVKTHDLKSKKQICLNLQPVDELLSEHNLTFLGNEKIINQQVLIRDHYELVKTFQKANEILIHSEGIDPGVNALTEFSKIIFLKMYSENERNLSLKEKYFELINPKSSSSQIELVNEMFKCLNKKYETISVFENTKIKENKNLNKILELIKNLNLRDTKEDVKGMAFEYFIHSYSKGTNKLGQYFTPRHIVKWLIKLIQPKIGEKIYDPFCGTGGMLIYSWNHLKLIAKNDDEIKILKNKSFYGSDISSSATIAKMNMILFGDGHNNIKREDSFKKFYRNYKDWGKFDIVITNFPFSQKTDFSGRYPLPNSNINGICIQHCLLSLNNKESSRVGIICPTSFLYSNENKPDREWILNNYKLERVIDMHQYSFAPYTLQNTAILIIKNKSIKDKDYFLFNYISDDGFSKDAYRSRIDRNDFERIFNSDDKINKKIYFRDLGSEKTFKILKNDLNNHEGGGAKS